MQHNSTTYQFLVQVERSWLAKLRRVGVGSGTGATAEPLSSLVITFAAISSSSSLDMELTMSNSSSTAGSEGSSDTSTWGNIVSFAGRKMNKVNAEVQEEIERQKYK